MFITIIKRCKYSVFKNFYKFQPLKFLFFLKKITKNKRFTIKKKASMSYKALIISYLKFKQIIQFFFIKFQKKLLTIEKQ